ncbi:alpha/beta hydrolase [Pseudaminobacter sp. 19-2017]|uniref:Alpha/beta hydrolase n=1 Tax=Pseudaminobacter soli (ex Zhang et al. 2022) TaxID=2831468 RepID=A0A942I9V0_9HYPH|nr:alpha/beta hydrolase [Pseudaminobacter soli]MBS3650690.1 alpha/beta hydrolase [Pseudaminobacter soli]
MADDKGFDDFFYESRDGLRLHARIYGSQDDRRLPVVCLPGLTRNARDFHELALFLSRHPTVPRSVIAFDYRGRGASDYDPDPKNYTIAIEAEDVLTGLSALGIAKADFIGTSRGGLIIHVLATAQPTLFSAIVLNDIGPVLGTQGLAHIRSYLESPRTPSDFADAVAIHQAIHAAAFPALSSADWDRMIAAMYREENGRLLADFDPALVGTFAASEPDQPVPELWEQFERLSAVPLMVIRGQNSLLLLAETVEEMSRRHPRLEVIAVPGQGHPPILETGDLPDLIAQFLARADANSASS